MRQETFERLYEEHAQPLFGFLVYRTGDRFLAEDLLSQTFEKVLRARRQFDPRRGTQKAWLYSIALNVLRDHARRAAAEQRAVERTEALVREGDGVTTPSEAVEDRDLLQRSLAKLSPEEREAISLRYGADLTVPEIARVVREPLTTIEGRVKRALRKLRDELE